MKTLDFKVDVCVTDIDTDAHTDDWLNIFISSFLTKHAIKQYKYYIHNKNNHMW